MESTSNDFISDFEEYCIRKINENKKFESLTDEEIIEKIDKLKKNCFLLQIKNEIFEKYLRRHNFGALREMEKVMENECYETSVMDIIFEDEEITTLKSKELLDSTFPNSTEQENIEFLIKVVEQEISELCLQSKALKTMYDKKIVSLTGEVESYNTQIDNLQKVYDAMKEHYPEDLYQAKQKSIRISELVKFNENLIKNVNIQIRKTSLASFNLQKEYIKLWRNEYIEDYPVSAADGKLLEIENEKLRSELNKDNQVYLDLNYLLGSYEMKFKKQKSCLLKLKDTQLKLEREIKKQDKRLLSLEKYNLNLQKEVMQLEEEKKKLSELSHYTSCVPTPRQYIKEYEKMYRSTEENEKS